MGGWKIATNKNLSGKKPLTGNTPNYPLIKGGWQIVPEGTVQLSLDLFVSDDGLCLPAYGISGMTTLATVNGRTGSLVPRRLNWAFTTSKRLSALAMVVVKPKALLVKLPTC